MMKKEEFVKQIGEILRKIRNDKNMSLKDVAKRLNISINSVANFENGNTDISVSRLQQLSEVYNIHIGDIFADKGYIDAKMEDMREEMKEYQKKHEKAQDKIIELQAKLSDKDRNSKYK